MFGMGEYLKEQEESQEFSPFLGEGEYKDIYNEDPPNIESENLNASAKESTVPVQVPTVDVEETPGVEPADIPDDEFKKGKGLLNIGGSEGMPGIFGKIQKFGQQGGLLGKAMKGMNPDLSDLDVTSKISEFTDSFTGGEGLGSMLSSFGQSSPSAPQTTTSTIQNAASSGQDEYSQRRPQGAYF